MTSRSKKVAKVAKTIVRDKPPRRGKSQPNYFAGRRAEYRSIELLENAGFLCVRAAGSKGPADIVALAGGGGPTTLVQVKRGDRGISPLDREKLKEIKAKYGCNVLVHRWKKHARHPLTEEIQ